MSIYASKERVGAAYNKAVSVPEVLPPIATVILVVYFSVFTLIGSTNKLYNCFLLCNEYHPV